MNEKKLGKLFAAARNEAAPTPPADFAAEALRAVRREKIIPPPGTFSVFEPLNRLFPRFALASSAVIVLGVAADYALTAAGVPELGEGVSQVSAQWFLTPAGF
jgi:hypothetical protein